MSSALLRCCFVLALCGAAFLPARAQNCGCGPGSGYADRTAWHVPTGLRVHLHGGYSSYTLGDLSDLHQGVADLYREAANIAVPTQTEFPNWYTFGAGVSHTKTGHFIYGLDVYYATTSAYSRYRDRFGFLNVSTDVNVTALLGSVEIVPLPHKRVRPLFNVRPGIYLIRSEQREDLTLVEDGTSFTTIEASGIAYGGEASVGASMTLFGQEIAAMGGYRYAQANKMQLEVTASDALGGSGEGELEHNLSGLVFRVEMRLALGFGW